MMNLKFNGVDAYFAYFPQDIHTELLSILNPTPQNMLVNIIF